MNVGAALDATQREYLDQAAATTLDANGQSVLRSYQVADTAKPVRVTLAWTDPPPATVTGNAFVNDLDLEVSVGGRIYRGNWLAGGLSVPGGQADFRNNVENVVLPASTGGRMSVKVIAKTLGGDGVPGNGKPLDQDFALVVSNAQEQALLAGARAGRRDGRRHGGRSRTATASSSRGVLRSDASASATRARTWPRGLLHALRERPAERQQPSSSYPDITADSEQQNTTPYQGPRHRCDVRRRCDRDARRDERRGRHPGRAGHDPDRPLRPPDDALAHPDARDPRRRRRRRRLHPVRADQRAHQGPERPLRALAHTFVGDLKVELTSPDNATTVRPVEHVGGRTTAATT